MKIKHFLVIFFVCLITFVCLARMNYRFDRLARYPYEDKQARSLIDHYLNDEEIEYIIEYSISPVEFINYIGKPGFSIYHVKGYQELEGAMWYAKPEEIIQTFELMMEYSDDLELIKENLHHYHANVINDYLMNLSSYNNLPLVEYPEALNVKLDKNHTLAKYVPENLVSYENVYIKEEALNSYLELLDSINNKYNRKDGGKISIINGYINYDNLKNLEKDIPGIYAGQNDHQTGLAIDLDLSTSIFTNEDNLKWLNKELKYYGFKLENCQLADYHIRYNPDLKVEKVDE